MKLKINRNEWLRGEELHSCLLRDDDGKMCCLGIYGRAIGVPVAGLLDQPEPVRRFDDSETSFPWPDWLALPANWGGPPTDEEQLIRVNDDASIEDDTREEQIAAIFARHGVEVTFYDGPAARPVRR